ncbi:hypothetical protein VNO77_07824 [Canavalia gladiata]|uniref:Uncharacterized protein n=1 Tax=Canavalia gladiata TaxID=3824 RepID=A0AAN9QTK1_CANGL
MEQHRIQHFRRRMGPVSGEPPTPLITFRGRRWTLVDSCFESTFTEWMNPRKAQGGTAFNCSSLLGSAYEIRMANLRAPVAILFRFSSEPRLNSVFTPLLFLPESLEKAEQVSSKALPLLAKNNPAKKRTPKSSSHLLL